ncbi:FixH family protein [Pontibacter chitinilyticus]|uniref:FixH family protein n=1 Tax=Pontibacter chitinilyticus TaxID=2674989 RepID=UPI00321B99A0
MATIENQDKKSFTLWPYAIITAMLLFMGYIASFVYQAMNQDVDLVSKNYYEQELAFQDHMNAVDRTKEMGDVAVTYNAEAQTISLQLPKPFSGKRISGKINFFRPSNDKLDFELPFQPDASLYQVLNAAKLEKGYWKVRVNYSADQQTYFTEQRIQIN